MGKYSTIHKKLDKIQNENKAKVAPLMAFINTTKGECDASISFWDGKPYPKSIRSENLVGHFANYEEAMNEIATIQGLFPPTSTGIVYFTGEDDLID